MVSESSTGTTHSTNVDSRHSITYNVRGDLHATYQLQINFCSGEHVLYQEASGTYTALQERTDVLGAAVGTYFILFYLQHSRP